MKKLTSDSCLAPLKTPFDQNYTTTMRTILTAKSLQDFSSGPSPTPTIILPLNLNVFVLTI